MLVSILVLMELCIKTIKTNAKGGKENGFNPCFNGTMYKNNQVEIVSGFIPYSFNPCFNGTMYKNGELLKSIPRNRYCFNPCFNGTMYKNFYNYNKQSVILIGFNPCFNGTMYKNSGHNPQRLSMHWFQSLF